MSGGHFDYNCFKIAQFAEDLQDEIILNNDESKDELGDSRGHQYSEETIEILQDCQKVIELAGKMAQDIEWLYSGDIGEESFRKKILKLVDEF